MVNQKKYFIRQGTLINFIFVLCFFIYVKKLPLHIETQPFLLFGLSIFLLVVEKIKLTIKDAILVFYLLLLSIYFSIQFSVFRTGFIEYITYLVGPIVYLVLKDKTHLFSLKYAKLITLLFASLTFIIFLTHSKNKVF